MESITPYKQWENEIKRLKDELLKRDILLRQYAIWMESSEEFTKYKGEDVYHMLMGVLQGLSDVDFIPGVGNMNFIAVVSDVQKETGLDLGVCKFLKDYIREYKQFEYEGVLPKHACSECGCKEGLGIASLDLCLPPKRSECSYRRLKSELEELAVR